ncbi:hypothetical protein BDV10DRAFT_199481 [Aspergillus recurvatus]
MSLESEAREKMDRVLNRDPNATIFLRLIAAPAALGLAGFAGSTWITATYIARWWGDESSPTIFFPFVAFWGGLGQFIAGFFGFAARDTLVTVIHVLWGTFFTWSGALASSARDLILCGVLCTLAIGSTIACCLFAYGGGVGTGMKAAAYFWIISSILAWGRVTVYLMEEAFGKGPALKFFPIFRTPMENRKPLLVPGFGEPGVKRGMPGLT